MSAARGRGVGPGGPTWRPVPGRSGCAEMRPARGRPSRGGPAAAAAWLVYLLARAEGATRVSAGIGAALLLPQPLVGPWTMALRPDLPALALSLAALVLATRRPARVGPAAAVAALALFTKQNE